MRGLVFMNNLGESLETKKQISLENQTLMIYFFWG